MPAGTRKNICLSLSSSRTGYLLSSLTSATTTPPMSRRITSSSKTTMDGTTTTGGAFKVFPIYDWKDKDVWLYIKRNDLEIPITYIYLYKCGVTRNKLRISQFFSIDTIRTLPKLLEFYPELYERVIRREPNADMVIMYWNTSMFRNSGQDKDFHVEHDWKSKLAEEMKKASANPSNYPGYIEAKRLLSNVTNETYAKVYQDIYNVLMAGDPKRRAYRAILFSIKSTKA